MSNIFFYPNRPSLVPPDPVSPMKPCRDYIDGLESSGRYVCERKFNGDNCYMYSPTEFWNRHRSRHRYVPSPEALVELKRLPSGGVYNVELVNYRTKRIKDLIVVHCLMGWKGKPLIGKDWGYSRKILEDLDCYGEHVVLSPVFRSGFWEKFQEADGVEIEGIILKDPMGKLVFSTTPIPDVSWALKIRKPCKKYQF